MAIVKLTHEQMYLAALNKLDYATDDTLKEMVNAGLKIIAAEIRAAFPKFRKHIRRRSAKKNEWGWFGQVQFKGKTRTGAPAALAAIAYNYGRYSRRHKFIDGVHRLEAIQQDYSGAVDQAMTQIYNDKLKSLGFDEE